METVVNNDERALLLSVALWIAEEEEADARQRGTTSHWAEELRRLMKSVRPKDPSGSDQ